MRTLTRLVAIFMIGHLLLGCGNSSRKKGKVFTDAKEREVTVPSDIKRIVSMAPNVTEMLFAIGLEDKVAGVTNFCDYPDAAREKPRIGGYSDPSIEAILALAPDLIIATPDGYIKEKVERLEQSGVSIYIINPQSVDEVLDTLMTLGEITNKRDKAKQIVEDLRKRVETVRAKVESIPLNERPKVFYEIGQKPLITVGSGNFLDSLISAAGGINIASDAKMPWPQYSIEAVIMKKPDVIITSPYTSLETWHRCPSIPAVQNGRIYPVDPNILQRPGPRIVDGLEKLYSLFYEDTPPG